MDRPQPMFGILFQQDERAKPAPPNIGQAAPKNKPALAAGTCFLCDGPPLHHQGEERWMLTKKALR